MRRRLYYLLPDAGSARRIMDDLLLARIEERHIHFLARPGTPMEGLHEANVLQKTDLVHGAQQGALIGAALGCAAGLLLVYFVIPDPKWQVATVFLATGLAALFGGWVASMTGAAIPNSRHRQFERDVEAGKILLMVDVPEHKVGDVHELVGRTHPEAVDRGVEVNVPVFPRRASRPALTRPLPACGREGARRAGEGSQRYRNARQIFSGVSGICSVSTANFGLARAIASSTALTTVGVAPMVPSSPTPFTPRWLLVDGVASSIVMSKGPTIPARGSA
jgi:hypothetical protein